MNWTVDHSTGCWLWNGDVDAQGYGFVFRGNSRVKAYLVVYVQHEGAVPEGLVLDHGCGVRRCVAPHHLEAVTQQENVWRKQWRYRSKLERCKKGHDMRENSIVLPETKGRVCRQCNRDANGEAR